MVDRERGRSRPARCLDPRAGSVALSHQLRSGLASIQGHVELLLEGDLGELDTHKREALTRVERNSRQLFRVVTQVEDALSMSPVRPARREPVRIDELIVQVATEIGRTPRNGRIEVQLDQTGPITVEGDHGQLAAVFTHLISGAARTARRGEQVPVSVRRRADDVEVTVNEGNGRRDQPRLPKWAPRDNLDEAADLHLGLTIVRSVVAAHGGTISLTPLRRRRVCVAVRLPARERST